MKIKLDAVLKASTEYCFERGLLEKTPLPDYVIEVPNNSDHGHFATNLPLILASDQKRSPLEIASLIVDHLIDEESLLEKAEVAGPGFINFRIRPKEWYRILSDIVRLIKIKNPFSGSKHRCCSKTFNKKIYQIYTQNRKN